MTTALMAEPLSIPGWFHHGEKILELIEQHRPKVCVELGTWLGASAIPVARSIQRWGGTLTCVDTWAGELNEDGGSVSQNPIMLGSCARSMVEAGVGANVRLIPATTAAAAVTWGDQPIDFLYIDADHSYEGVWTDLEAWVPYVRSGGLIVGDDYGNASFPGVKRAWDEFEVMQDLTLTRYQSDPPLPTQMIYGVKP